MFFFKTIIASSRYASKLFSASRLLVPSLPPWTLPDRSWSRLSCDRLRYSGFSFLGVALRDCGLALWWTSDTVVVGAAWWQWGVYTKCGGARLAGVVVVVVWWSQVSWEADSW